MNDEDAICQKCEQPMTLHPRRQIATSYCDECAQDLAERFEKALREISSMLLTYNGCIRVAKKALED